MNPVDLFNQVKELIANKDFEGAKQFIEDNKDQFGDYLEQANGLLSGSEGGKRPITRYLSNHSLLQYTVIKKLEDFLCHNPSSR